jgi:dTDP-4-dehydrorhamnose reductase
MPPVIEPLPIKDAYVVTFDRPHDNRGYFNEFYNETTYPEIIRGSIAGDWKQVAVSMTENVNTIRGLHMSPYNKFCSVLTGGIYDIIVDMREDSPTFMKWCSCRITEANKRQVHIPAFCLHGFMAVEPSTRMLYLQGGTFSLGQESDCNPFDKLIDAHWPLLNSEPIISDKDRNAPLITHESRRPQLSLRVTMPRILIIGASGQVGSALVQEYRRHNYLVYGTHNSHPFPGEHTVRFNLEEAAAEPSFAEELIDMMHPSIIVICSAFTWVDGAEDAKDRVHAVNVAGPAAVAMAAKRIGAKLVVFGTDYIWDGKSGPYNEDDPPNPVNVYGKSKVDMEQRLLGIDAASLILRTTVVYGPERQGKNFIYQLCKKLGSSQSMDVITDQISTPTYNRDLAVLTRMLVDAGACGVFNACGEEVLDRHSFATIAAKELGMDAALIRPCLTSKNPKATRPLNAGMHMGKALAFLEGRFKPKTVKEAIADWCANPGDGNAPLDISRSEGTPTATASRL